MGDKPTHTLWLTLKDNTNIKRPVGSGWVNKWGAVSIVLDPAIVLDWRICGEYYLTLKPSPPERWHKNRKNGVEEEPPKG